MTAHRSTTRFTTAGERGARAARVRGPSWILDLQPGWTAWPHRSAPRAAPREDRCVALVPPTADAALRLFTWYDERPDPDSAASTAMMEWLAERGMTITRARCGDFSGYEGSEMLDGERWRHWWLAAGAAPLGAVYRGDPATAARDGAAVNAMLATLRARPTAYGVRRACARLAPRWVR